MGNYTRFPDGSGGGGGGDATAENQVLEIAAIESTLREVDSPYTFDENVTMIGVVSSDTEAAPLFADSNGNLLVADYYLKDALKLQGALPAGGTPYGVTVGGYSPTNTFLSLNFDALGNLRIAIDQSAPGVSNAVQINADSSTTSTITNPTPLATSFVIVGSNAARKGLRVVNDTNVKMCLAFAGTATVTAYTAPIYPGGYYNMEKPIHTGAVTAICVSTPTGTVAVTET